MRIIMSSSFEIIVEIKFYFDSVVEVTFNSLK